MSNKGYIVSIKVGAESLNIFFESPFDALDIHNKIFTGALECDNPPFKVSIKEDYKDE